jgi:beta-glucosidase
VKNSIIYQLVPALFSLFFLFASDDCQPVEPYKDPNLAVNQRVNDLIARMTLEEKIGQMTQVDKNSILLQDITEYEIGSLLSGGGGYPSPNNPNGWADMTDRFQRMALKSRLGIPLIYGADAVHGHSNVKGAVIFPHNIGLGAARDSELVKQVGRITALEMAATGVFWNFAPTVAVPQDIRWGRTYEGYSENTELVSSLSTAYILGLQNTDNNGFGSRGTVLATPKHFIGDGGTAWGSAMSRLVDQGDVQTDEEFVRKMFLPPYQNAIVNGARCIMISYSSWKGIKMHENKYLLTNVLKGEIEFQGFLVSDYQAIDQLPGDYYSDVVTSINAGLDMIMISQYYSKFIETLNEAVKRGDVPITRIDDAVRRILKVKFELGLFERPFAERDLLPLVGSPEHRVVAREAVRKSLVLLKNNNSVLPVSKKISSVIVAGSAADDIGIQCGGWTIEWQGKPGPITTGTTILQGIRNTLEAGTVVDFEVRGEFRAKKDHDGNKIKADLGIVVVGEVPYAEGSGDQWDLSITKKDIEIVKRVRAQCKNLVLILVSGRPLIITKILDQCDAIVAAWLPGTEAQGIADVLFGDYPFTGKLPYTWPDSMEQLPFHFDILDEHSGLFPFGFGLQ